MIMKEKHTQGEWRSEKSEEIVIHSKLRRGKINFTQPVAKLFLYGEESEANAKLIAAAPDLLEALKDVLETLKPESVDLDRRRVGSKGIPSDESICKAIEAIKQARE